MRNSRLLVACCTAVCLSFTCGCSDSLGLARVQGTVTLDGQPLNNAQVIFQPEAGGRPSGGRTDVDGRYSLQYIEGQSGALPGAHKVTISTFIEPDGDSDDPLKQVGQAEKVPARYNAQTTLKVELKPGESSHQDFTLVSAEGS